MTNEIRADALDVTIYERLCNLSSINDCDTTKISSNLENEIKLAILKKAAILEKENLKKTIKRNRKQMNIEGARESLFDK